LVRISDGALAFTSMGVNADRSVSEAIF
jgi:hypothetical protein